MNSFRSLERAVQYEIDRQIELIESSGIVVQETRHWDEEAGLTRSMRTKEGSSDYRYFAEPDLVPMRMDEEWVERIRATLPELPAARIERYIASGLDAGSAAVLSGADNPIRALYESAVAEGAEARTAANWVTGEVTAWLRREDGAEAGDLLTGRQLAELLDLIDQGTVSSSAAKDVLDGVLSGEGDPGEVARSRDLLQVSDTGVIEAAVDAVLANNPDVLESLRSGETKVLGFLVGQVMKATQGKADPKLVNEVIRARAGD
jgi:aspartyl-tRNA(Asn)/glutamyl-tRNA(Gln) amidotransferase subunit B